MMDKGVYIQILHFTGNECINSSTFNMLSNISYFGNPPMPASMIEHIIGSELIFT